MSDITITASSVTPYSNAAAPTPGYAGEAVTAGQAAYQDSSNGKWYKADANDATKIDCKGIFLNSASADQPVSIAGPGAVVNIGATVVVGTVYVLSATAGGIAPAADLTSGWYTVVVGIGVTTGRLKLFFAQGGVAVA